MSNKNIIPVFDGNYTSNEEKYLIDVIRSGTISSQGKYVTAFEKSFSQYLGSDYGVAVSNGTVALEAAYYAIGLEENDEIIMPSFTIISCAIGAIRLGAIPVFVDVDDQTWCIDPDKIEKEISPKTKAILVVHMYGHACDMDRILEIAHKHNLFVIEDASQVHGGEYKGRKCGSIGDVSTFSFYANKIISTGEGGMIVTSNQEFADRAMSYRNLCFLPEKRFYHSELGNNYRLGNLQAAVGVAQLEKIEDHIAVKIKNGLLYRKYLSEIDIIQVQTQKDYCKMVYWMYCIVLSDKYPFNASDLSRLLYSEYLIETRPFFIGLHLQPVIQKYLNKKNRLCVETNFPITEKIAQKGLYLPSGFNITEEQIEYICSSVKKVLNYLKHN